MKTFVGVVVNEAFSGNNFKNHAKLDKFNSNFINNHFVFVVSERIK